MFLDIIILALLILAIYKGFTKGLIVGLFSFVAIFVGLAAATKLSAVVAKQIGGTVKVSEHWLPVLSFIVVFIAVLLLVRIGAKALEKTVELAMLGWVNRIGGIVFYILIYLGIASVAIFYAEQLKWLQPDVKEKSVAYPYVAPIGPKAISAIGYAIPVFKDTFKELETFFGGVSDSIEPTPKP